MTKKPEIPPTHLIRDLETLKVISDPFRIDIIRLIHEANIRGRFATVKEISEALDLPPTKLYYHINLLEKHGLIIVGDTQIVSGIIEKQYQIVAEDITVDPDILTGSEATEDEKLEFLLDSVKAFLDSTYQDVKKGMTEAFAKKADEAEKEKSTSYMTYTKSDFYLTKAQAEELGKELKEIEKVYDKLSKQNFKDQTESHPYGLSIIVAPHHHKSSLINESETKSND